MNADVIDFMKFNLRDSGPLRFQLLSSVVIGKPAHLRLRAKNKNKADLKICCPKIIQQLSFMCDDDCFRGLQLQQ